MHTCTGGAGLGSNPTASVRLEKGALRVASSIPTETKALLAEVSLKPPPPPLAVTF